MKSNVVMPSKDRELFGVTIKQDTKTQFLSVTDLQDSYSRGRIENDWVTKNINEILTGKENTERVYYVLNESNAINIEKSIFMKEVDSSSLVKVMKKYGVYKTAGRGDNRCVMCNPYIFALIAMELNPLIYAKVVIWLGDNLILNRIEAGDRYNALCRSASKFPDVDYRSIAKGLNWIVFGYHETLLRDKGTQAELKELDDLQKSLSFAVDMGYIKSFDSLMDEMRKAYKLKQQSERKELNGDNSAH